MHEKIEYIKNEYKSKIEEFKFGTKTMFKEFFNKETNKKQRANMWTFLRLVVPIPIIFCSIGAIALTSNILYSVTAGLVGLGALTDYFDGKSARKYQSSSQYGKLLDQFADKIFAGVVGINLLIINPLYIIALLGELFIAVINISFKINYNYLDITSSKIGKIKEWPLFISLGLGFLSPINSTLLTISNTSVAITILFQYLTAKSYLKNNLNEVLKIEKEKRNKIDLANEDKEDKTKEKELVIKKENKSATDKLEELREFRNTLTETTEIKNDEINNIQKTKTLN